MPENLESLMKIDIGGTPSNVLGKTKKSIAEAMGYVKSDMVAIMDPFNLARIERILPLGESYKIKQIKFSVEVPGGNTDLSSEEVRPPTPDYIRESMNDAKGKVIGKMVQDYAGLNKNRRELEKRYDYLVEEIVKRAKDSGNLRDFMNQIVSLFLPDVEMIKLEDIFSKNPDITYNLIGKFNVPVRAICPRCNTFRSVKLGERLECCDITSDEIIRSGRFIPEEGFFPVLTALNGYSTVTIEGKEYINKARNILKELGKDPNSLAVEYTTQKINRTMFEDFLLKNLIEDKGE